MAITRALNVRRYSQRHYHYLTSRHRSRIDGACGDHPTGDAFTRTPLRRRSPGRVFLWHASTPISSHQERPLLFVVPFASSTDWYYCAATESPPASLTSSSTLPNDPSGCTHVILLQRRRSSSRAPACACCRPTYAPPTRSPTTRDAGANLAHTLMPTANLHKASFFHIEEKATAMYRTPRLQSQIPGEYP
jgi:hypothetical protein